MGEISYSLPRAIIHLDSLLISCHSPKVLWLFVVISSFHARYARHGGTLNDRQAEPGTRNRSNHFASALVSPTDDGRVRSWRGR